MINPLGTWVSSFTTLPQVLDPSWASNIAQWTWDNVHDARLTDITTASPPFPFAQSVFEAQLMTLTPSIDINAAIAAFANAWETAVIASQPLLVTSGDSIGGGGPSNTWSVVSSAILNPGSIAAGKAIIMSLISAPMVIDASLSQFPTIMRNSFLALKGDISGMSSDSPTPVPLNAMGVSFI